MANPLFDQLFGRHAGKETPFLKMQGGQVISHADFLAMTARFANVFQQLGLVAGDRLALQVEKSPQALAVYAAAVQSGIVFLPLNTGYTAKELAYFIENSGARLLIC
ncbi:MAG: AMP-binding protein, partial [Pseudomonadota bacterium]